MILYFYFDFKITNFKLPVIDPMQKGGKKSKKINKTIFFNAQLGNCTFNTLNYNVLTFLMYNRDVWNKLVVKVKKINPSFF